MDDLLSPLHALTVKKTNIELSIGLFRALCERNLSGQVSFESLREYAVGYALRRFTINNRVITNPSITY